MQWLFWRRRNREAELEEEIAHDLWLDAQERARSGQDVAEAERASRKDFGNVLLIKEATREIWTSRTLEVAAQDLRYTVRTLRHSPAFATTAVLTLALGLGVNTAMFTIFDQIAFRPLPIADGGRVVAIYESFRGTFDRKIHGNSHMLSYHEFREYESQNHVFSEIAAYADIRQLTLDSGEPEPVSGVLVTHDYFKVLRAKIALGRSFAADELAGPHAVAVLSHGFWQRRFGGDPRVVGKTIRLNRTPFTVVGITAPGFIGTTASLPDLWLPLSEQPAVMADLPPGEPQNFLVAENLGWLSALGRLKDGESLEHAQTDLQVIAARLDLSYPGRHTEVSTLVGTFMSNPDARPAVLIGGSLALVAVGLVLFVACANVANLLIARATGRQREIAVRLAIGASRARLVRQLLTESTVIALLGGGAGVLLAYKALEFGRRTLNVPQAIDLHPDVKVLSYTLLLSIGASVIFGLAPALRATSPELSAGLKGEGSLAGTGVPNARLRNGLISAQVAICCVFLAAAGLLFRGLINLNRIDPGFQVKNVLLTSLDLKTHDNDDARGAEFYRELLAGIDRDPGTESTLASSVPLRGVSTTGVALPGWDVNVPLREAHFNHVSRTYFRVLGIPLSQGRTFTDSEVAAGAAVAIISEAMRAAYWPQGAVIGKRFQYGMKGRLATVEVIGVVADVRASHIASADGPLFYVPIRPQDRAFVITRSVTVPTLASRVQQLVHQLDPSVLVSVRTMEDNLRDEVEPTRVGATSAFLLAALALALAAVGIYGVTAYIVTQRTREVGIRMALGAERSEILRWVMWQAMRPVGLGVLVGLPIAAAGARAASRLLLGVHPLDPIAFVSVPAFLAAVALVASFLPGRRATLVDPVAALRHE